MPMNLKKQGMTWKTTWLDNRMKAWQDIQVCACIYSIMHVHVDNKQS